MRVPRRAHVALLAVMLMAAEPAGAQEGERRGFIGLGIGPSFPLGSFGQGASATEAGGRATLGYTDTFLNIGRRLGESLGLAVALSYSEYPMRGVGDDDWWQVAAISVGPMYSVRLNARAALDLKAMLGMIVLTPVEDSFTTVDGSVPSLGVDVRAALRYDVLRRWALFAEGGLQSSRPAFHAGARSDYLALISGFGFAFRPTW